MDEAQDYWIGLFAFVRTATTGSFTKAAQALGVTPSAVSRAVSRLEQRIGATLFKRSTRALVLSPEGSRFLAQVAPLLDELDNVQASFDAKKPPSGTVRVTAPIDLGRALVASWAEEFAAHVPGLSLELTITDRLVDLRHEAVDIAIRLGSVPASETTYEIVGALGYAIVAAPSYIARRGTPRTPGDLAGHACLQYITIGGTPLRWSLAGEELATSGPFATDDGGALLSAALAGAGIAHMLRFAVAPALADGRLVEVLADVPKTELIVSLSHPFKAHPPGRVTATLAFLRSRLSSADLPHARPTRTARGKR